ncbi:hypothetical protein DSUL_20555 [Desulfovibrionales bacterium]
MMGIIFLVGHAFVYFSVNSGIFSFLFTFGHYLKYFSYIVFLGQGRIGKVLC